MDNENRVEPIEDILRGSCESEEDHKALDADIEAGVFAGLTDWDTTGATGRPPPPWPAKEFVSDMLAPEIRERINTYQHFQELARRVMRLNELDLQLKSTVFELHIFLHDWPGLETSPYAKLLMDLTQDLHQFYNDNM